MASPVMAAKNIITDTKIVLTEDLLQQKINNLIQREGQETIDLSNLIINLTENNLEFSTYFYQQLQTKISRTPIPVSLNFSNSLVKGEFNTSKLGIQTRLEEEALSSLLTPNEQKLIKQENELFPLPGEQIATVTVIRGVVNFNRTDFRGKVDLSNTLFLQKIIATEAKFKQAIDWSNTSYGDDLDLSNATFNLDTSFEHSLFLGKVKFQNSVFQKTANFSKCEFYQSADFSKINWRDRAIFSKSRFLQSLIFTNSTFVGGATFRDARFNNVIDFQDASFLEKVDFSNAVFTPDVKINVAGLAFDSEETKIIGETGAIGKVIAVSNLDGNEIVLRNLVRNFRNLEQIPDANQIEYKREKLRLNKLVNQLIGTPWRKILSWNWMRKIGQWLGLIILLLLGDYGTNFSSVLGVGTIAIAYFSILFWLVDRFRRLLPQPIIPNRYETICMLGSYSLFTCLGITDILISTERPWLTLACLAVILLPLPLILLIRLYLKGRYHKLLDITYFVEDGSMRQFRLMLGRLPIMPRFPFYRDRYYPLLWERRWNWLNYYDLSLNNLLRFGFNDIRLRDEHLPGTIAILVWYQWSLGVMYIILLLWTLSRTIPGLNLLLYF